jgi:hypothetical protein
MLLSNCERMELHQADDLLPNQLLQPTSLKFLPFSSHGIEPNPL